MIYRPIEIFPYTSDADFLIATERVNEDMAQVRSRFEYSVAPQFEVIEENAIRVNPINEGPPNHQDIYTSVGFLVTVVITSGASTVSVTVPINPSTRAADIGYIINNALVAAGVQGTYVVETNNPPWAAGGIQIMVVNPGQHGTEVNVTMLAPNGTPNVTVTSPNSVYDDELEGIDNFALVVLGANVLDGDAETIDVVVFPKPVFEEHVRFPEMTGEVGTVIAFACREAASQLPNRDNTVWWPELIADEDDGSFAVTAGHEIGHIITQYGHVTNTNNTSQYNLMRLGGNLGSPETLNAKKRLDADSLQFDRIWQKSVNDVIGYNPLNIVWFEGIKEVR